MVLTRTHTIDKDLWYRQGPMVLTRTHGIESVLRNHTNTRGPSVTRMQVFLEYILISMRAAHWDSVSQVLSRSKKASKKALAPT